MEVSNKGETLTKRTDSRIEGFDSSSARGRKPGPTVVETAGRQSLRTRQQFRGSPRVRSTRSDLISRCVVLLQTVQIMPGVGGVEKLPRLSQVRCSLVLIAPKVPGEFRVELAFQIGHLKFLRKPQGFLPRRCRPA